MGSPIVQLLVDKYLSNVNRRQNIANPTWQHIEHAIRALDGDSCSSLAIVNADGDVLAIGGGESIYYVSMDTDDYAYVLTNGGFDETLVEIVVGGVDTPLPGNCLVDLDDALSAANAFWSGALDTNTPPWELA